MDEGPWPDATDEEQQALNYLSVALGWKEQDRLHPDRVTQIELVLDDYPSMQTLRYFPNLVSCCLISQAIQNISGLQRSSRLEQLWLNENDISSLSGLEACTSLKQLYCCSNRLTSIGTALVNTTELEVLMLADNALTSLKGLSTLGKLRDLNVAKNQIRSVVGVFHSNVNLATVNVAGNCLTRFRDLLEFSKLPSLTELNVADPDWGENPLCQLCNYQTYIVNALPTLRIFDRIKLGPDASRLADATFQKKQLYYHMKIKAVKRQATDALKACRQLQHDRRQQVEAEVETVLRSLRRLEGKVLREDPQADTQGLAKVRAACAERYVDLEAAGVLWDELQQRLSACRALLSQRLLSELETGGNVRFEPGSAADPWFQAARDLVQSRFHQAEFAHLGIVGVEVVGVERVHNRFLRTRYDDRVDASGDARGPVEFLFHGQDPAADQQEALLVDGLDDAKTCLVGSLADAELPRLQDFLAAPAGKALLRAGRFQDLSAWADEDHLALGKGLVRFPPGQVCVWSLFLGGAGVRPCAESTYLRPRSFAEMLAERPPAAPAEDEPVAATFRTQKDGAGKMWMVWDHCRALPEYIVTVEYVYAKAEAEEPGPPVGPTLPAFQRLCELYKQWTLPCRPPPELPVVEERTALDRLTAAAVQAVAKGAKARDVLDLHGRQIRRIEPSAFADVPVRTLLLSFNRLESTALSVLPQLVRLDLSFNLLQKLDRLPCPLLSELDLSWNSLMFLEDLSVLGRDAPQITQLALLGNHLCDLRDYRKTVRQQLPRLERLDEQPFPPQAEASEDLPFEQLLLQGAKVQHLPDTAWGSTGIAVSQLLALTDGDPSLTRIRDSRGITSQNWPAHARELDLAGHGLTCADLRQFKQLVKLDLSRNQLTQLGLCQLPSLRELAVEDNQLTQLCDLAELAPRLKRLDAGGNRISDIGCLQGLGLEQLSLEDNYIDNFDGIAVCAELVELYLSNNLVEEVRSILVLKALPRLIVLDLAGNAFCEGEYRPYTIFHLRNLKVLDGDPVSAQEVQASRERFAGRLTIELLEEKIGPAGACYSFRTVDFSSCKLRDLGQFLTDDYFPSIRELTLDDNLLTSIATLGPLSKLLVLRANRNRLDLAKGLGDSTVSGLRSLPLLQVLEMGGNHISDLAPLQHFPLTSLRILHLPGNEIQRVEGLAHLEQLRELVLERNKIRGLEEKSVAGLRALRELHLDDNCFRSLSHFLPLPRLRVLFLGLNRIPDFGEIDKLRELRSLIQVSFVNNAVARKPLYRAHAIRTLASVRILDGKEVLPDERERADLLFCQEPEPSPAPVYIFTDQSSSGPVHVSMPGGQGSAAPSLLAKPAKLPVKVTSLNFGNSQREQPSAGPERKTGPTIMALGQGLEPSGLGDLRPPSRGSAARQQLPRGPAGDVRRPSAPLGKDLKQQRKSLPAARQSPRMPAAPSRR